MNRQAFAAEIKRLEVGQEVKFRIEKPGSYRSLLSGMSLALERTYRTAMLSNGEWRIRRKG